MKAAIVDISRKVPLYDYALCEKLSSLFNNDDSFAFLAPHGPKSDDSPWELSMTSLMPGFLRHRYNIFRRIVKLVEVYNNYRQLIKYSKKNKLDVLHLQWLPLLEINGSEIFFLKKIKKANDIKIILTVHNLYPHNFNESQKHRYKERFIKASRYIDHFIVHTETSKKQLEENFGITGDKISVIYHGIFASDISCPVERNPNITKFIMFGTQSYYKGTDLLVKAYSSLSEEERAKSECCIIGQTSPKFYGELKEIADKAGIKWTPTFVDESVLNSEIMSSDVIVTPYRTITQSGVLLKALNYKKPIIAANLPAFRETLKGFTEDMFFIPDDIEDLKNHLSTYINHTKEINTQLKCIDALQSLYSWDKSASDTKMLYKKLLKN